MEIVVREANTSDIATLIKFNCALADETENILLDATILRSGIERALRLGDCQYFIAELEGRIVGQTMITSEWSDWRNGRMWWMQSVYVHPDYRKRGVFHKIFKTIETQAEQNPEIKALRLYVMQDNHAGKSAYQNLGMKHSGYVVYEKST
ncbi:MAG: GNAT family N-acetyltransferase [Nitrospinota bacterium]|nr:GNAT family N-acetyltransferase [Nitrospinota bacterium]